MLNIVTVNATDYLGRGVEYTNILYDSVIRNLAEGHEGRFIVFTDTPGDYAEGIIVKPLPVEGLNGWWNKLALFKYGVFEDGDRVVYIDLSTVITGRLDEIVAYDGKFAILRDFYRPDGMQSAFMAWEAGSVCGILTSWDDSGRPEVEGGDQAWIEQFCGYAGINADLWQHLFPDLFISYKVSKGAIPETASVVKFHGNPKPHDIVDGWVPQVWKVGGLTRAELDVICNTEKEVILSNVRSACERNLPWFDFPDADCPAVVCIVGGAPSLKNDIEQIRALQEMGAEIWALNGAAEYLCMRGLEPDVLVILDARPENAEFVRSDPAKSKYLLASQCHPDVFDMLEGWRADVTVFHNNTPGMVELLTPRTDKPVHLLGGGTTVGMKAMVLAKLSGFRVIHLFGMDSSYSDGKHHAYKQPLNDGERVLQVVVGDKTFECAPWMITQVNDFQALAAEFLADGITITVAGDGLLKYVAQNMTIPVTAADIRAHEILSRLPEGELHGAEIGVFAGDLSKRILSRSDIHLLMVDSWESQPEGQYAGSGDWHASLTQQQQDAYHDHTVHAVRFAGTRAKIFRLRSSPAAELVPDGSLDFVFIDADHSYAGCKEDLNAWWHKVKDGGLFSGHDYENTDFPEFGVTQAVDEFAHEHGLAIELGENFTWFVTKPKG